MLTDPLTFALVAFITAACLICLLAMLVGRIIRDGLDDQDLGGPRHPGGMDGRGSPSVVSLDLERARRNRDLGPAA